MYTRYVQHTDFSMEELGQTDCDGAVQAFNGFDPAGQVEAYLESGGRPEDLCPPMLGFESGNGDFLEVFSLDSSLFSVRYSYKASIKLLGLFPRTSWREKFREDVSREQVVEAIKAFFRLDPQHVAHIVSTLRK